MARLIRLGLLLLLLAPLPAWAEVPPAAPTGHAWLERANRSLHAWNQATAARLPALADPARLPPAWRGTAAQLIGTWAAEPWQALSLAAAGRGDQAALVIDRLRANILEGQGGLRDRATERGLPLPPPADLGLALCVRGVPEGPYLVLPLLGGRTLRDGLTELLVSQTLIHGVVGPILGGVPLLEGFAALDGLDRLPHWARAEREGGAPRTDARLLSFEAAREAHLAERREACAALRG